MEMTDAVLHKTFIRDLSIELGVKPRHEISPQQNKTKQNKTKQNETKQNKTHDRQETS